jgi:hypothetical protein
MRTIVLTSVMFSLVVAACGADSFSETPGEDGSSSSSGGGGGGFNFDAGPKVDANPYANDPPPRWCGADGGSIAPPAPGGTVECPNDKNNEGCPCSKAGETAACWPGLRANRNLGICRDGTTTCVARGETLLQWGPCNGAVLPQPGATKGAAACKCFSAGQWKLDNLSPCFFTQGGTITAVSTVIDASGKAQCPPLSSVPTQPPGDIWSHDTVKVDCAGHFKLCYEIKAGDFANPLASDCSVAKTCTEGDYLQENVEQSFPSLGGWLGHDSACAAKFQSAGGYGEMTVVGLSVRCDKVDDGAGNAYVFNRVRYCNQECMQNPSAPGCAGCGQGGSGTF